MRFNPDVCQRVGWFRGQLILACFGHDLIFLADLVLQLFKKKNSSKKNVSHQFQIYTFAFIF